MHGYGPTPQQQTTSRPSSATLTTVRVILVTVTVLSCGLLGWVAMLRLAFVTRRPRDWVLLAVVIALNAALFAFIMDTPDDPDAMSDASVLFMMVWIICLLAGVITYYLYVEIRHYSSLRSLGSPPPYTAPGHPAPLPYQQHPAQQQHQSHQQHQHQHQHQQQSQHPRPQPNPYTVQTPPPTPTPAPQRLDQVRAELDELSDYLRKENREGEGR